MTLREIRPLINCEFNLYIRGIKLIDNANYELPRDILDCYVEKIEFSDYIDIYLIEPEYAERLSKNSL